MTVNELIKDLRKTLMVVSDEARAKLSNRNLPSGAADYYSAVQKVLYPIFVFLDEADKKGEINMVKLKDSLSVEVVKLSDIQTSYRDSVWRDAIQKEVDDLAPGYAKLIDPNKISYGHLMSVVLRLQKNKQLDANIRVKKRGEKTYLVRL